MFLRLRRRLTGFMYRPMSQEYHARILSRISEVREADWDALVPEGHPFLTWRFLHALEDSGCAIEETGWAPRHIWLTDESGQPTGAAPLYAKTHSRGEYVFDHGWADALYRAGGDYYPKLQCSIPFTPATGPRLLAHNKTAKQALVTAMLQACQQLEHSGIHLTFLMDEDRAVLDEMGFLHREDRQFHFFNQSYSTFDDFLATLSSRKRKNIRKERKAAQDGIIIRSLTGSDLKPEHWDVFYACYLDTGARKWGAPYLNRDFFAHIHETMADDILLVMAWEGDTPIAAALNFIGGDALYGRNWGCLTHKPFLHFELCYYQAIDAAIEMGLSRVEAGAQGEHKLARGYEPVATHSAHFLAHPGLHEGVEHFLTRERRAVEHEIEILEQHTPFRRDV